MRRELFCVGDGTGSLPSTPVEKKRKLDEEHGEDDGPIAELHIKTSPVGMLQFMMSSPEARNEFTTYVSEAVQKELAPSVMVSRLEATGSPSGSRSRRRSLTPQKHDCWKCVMAECCLVSEEPQDLEFKKMRLNQVKECAKRIQTMSEVVTATEKTYSQEVKYGLLVADQAKQRERENEEKRLQEEQEAKRTTYLEWKKQEELDRRQKETDKRESLGLQPLTYCPIEEFVRECANEGNPVATKVKQEKDDKEKKTPTKSAGVATRRGSGSTSGSKRKYGPPVIEIPEEQAFLAWKTKADDSSESLDVNQENALNSDVQMDDKTFTQDQKSFLYLKNVLASKSDNSALGIRMKRLGAKLQDNISTDGDMFFVALAAQLGNIDVLHLRKSLVNFMGRHQEYVEVCILKDSFLILSISCGLVHLKETYSTTVFFRNLHRRISWPRQQTSSLIWATFNNQQRSPMRWRCS